MVRGAYFRKNFEDLFSYRGAQKLEWFEVLEGLWQYGLWSFQAGDTKLERFLPKNQQTQRKSFNFENRNNEVSKNWIFKRHLFSSSQ